MARDAALRISIIGDAKPFTRAVGDAEDKASRFGSTAKKVGKLVAVGIGAAAAGGLYALGKAAKVGFEEFNEGQKVAAQTNAVLKSTGGIAGVTAKDVDRLAKSLMQKSGVDDEAIKSGSNMLLTFTKIRNETGKGNDIFSQATKITLDLSVAMGKDMQSSAILVGKALNDPVKGVTALTKAGVQLSESQKETIKRMVESGNVMGAQKIILKELETQFGGSAKAAGKTFSGQLNILKETFKNTAGEVVGKFMPMLMRLAKLVIPLAGKALVAIGDAADRLIPHLQCVVKTVEDNWPAIRKAAGDIAATIRTNLVPIVVRVGSAVVAATKFFNDHRTTLKVLVGVVGGAIAAWRVYNALIKLNAARMAFMTGVTGANTTAQVLNTGAYKLGALAARAYAIAQRLVNAAMKANPIGLVITGLVLLGGALIAAWKKSETFRDIVMGVWNGIKAVVRTVVNWFTDTAWPRVRGFVENIGDKFAAVRNRISDLVHGIANRFRDLVDFFRRLPGRIWDAIKSIPGKVKKAFTFDLPAITVPFIGQPAARDIGAGAKGLVAGIRPALALGRRMGLAFTSGVRPGATVRGTGRLSDHALGKAVDMSGSAALMARYARAAAGYPGVETVIYSPLGLWLAGRGWSSIRSAITRADHYDHVHVDTFDKGGWLPPRSATLAINKTRYWEPVGPPQRDGNGSGNVIVQGDLNVKDETDARVLAAALGRQLMLRR